MTDGSAYTSSVGATGAITSFKKSANVTTVEVGVNAATQFCIVGTSASARAFLYDSSNGGIQQTSYSSATNAKAACPAITTYVATS